MLPLLQSRELTILAVGWAALHRIVAVAIASSFWSAALNLTCDKYDSGTRGFEPSDYGCPFNGLCRWDAKDGDRYRRSIPRTTGRSHTPAASAALVQIRYQFVRRLPIESQIS